MPHLLPAVPGFPSESDLPPGPFQHSDQHLPAVSAEVIFHLRH